MLREKTFENGFSYIEIVNAKANAKIALQGAHIFEYKAIDKPSLLWVSEKSYFEQHKAIRGGIPICFPWFGKHKEDTSLPQHGFVRTALWKLVISEELEDGSTHVRLRLSESTESLKQWAYKFELSLDVFVGETLRVALSISNTDSSAFEIGTALHTYLKVSDIKDVTISGIDGCSYVDALTKSEQIQKGILTVKDEIDRVYQTQGRSIVLSDTLQSINIKSNGSKSVVIWNPWKAKSSSMVDMSDDGYKSMFCVETSNALLDTRWLEPQEKHTLEAIYIQQQSHTTRK